LNPLQSELDYLPPAIKQNSCYSSILLIAIMKSVLFTVALLVAASAQVQGFRVQMEEDVAPHNPATSNWIKGSKPKQEDHMTLTVAMRIEQQNYENLEKVLYAVSDPKHKNYGEHLTIEQVTGILGVSDDKVNAVEKFFLEHGARSVVISPNRDMLTVIMPVRAVERALETTIHSFTHKERKAVTIFRASSGYSLPSDVGQHVALVGELLQFPALRSLGLQGLKGSGSWGHTCDNSACDGLVTPTVLSERYNFPNVTKAVEQNSMAVAEFQGQGFMKQDNEAFTQSCHRNVEVADNEGGVAPAGIEASLDIEYIRGVSPEIPLTVIYSAQYSLLNWANQINSNASSPLVHSVSYGNDEKQQSGRQYMLTCNTAFMKAGARGLSILFASGDQGVCGRSGCGWFKHKFNPDFPGGSPYITVVGGTNFHGNGIGEEEVWSDGGGGFSDNFPIPSYQAADVAAYKANKDANLPPQTLWNNTGRGYPDIAALAGQKTPYCVVSNGRWGGVAGTSAACPVAAGIFAKLNGVRLAAGKKPMGFLNPFIYQNPSGFNDVTIGMNNANYKIGFTAVKGWDASSGLGTPNFDALSKLV
jgi:tripeptidyl-peptidase-1